MTPGLFRFLIASNWLLITASVVTTFATEHRLPAALRDYLQVEAASPLDVPEANDLILLSVGVLFHLGVMIGLFLFRPWARTLLPFAILITVLLTPLAGPVVSHGFVAAIDYAASIVDGGILAAAFLPPISDRFRGDSRRRL